MNTRVELREQRTPAREIEQRRKQEVANLDGLGMIKAEEGAVAAVDPSGELIGYELIVNGITLPVLLAGWEVVATESGPAVTVTIPANTVQVGTGAVVEDRRDYTVRTWQGTERPDPRANIPGWKPEGVQSDG